MEELYCLIGWNRELNGIKGRRWQAVAGWNYPVILWKGIKNLTT